MEDVHKLMELDEGELYAILGGQTSLLENPTELQFWDRLSKTERIERGKIFFDKCEQRLKEKICNEWGYCGKKKIYNDDTTLMIGLIPVVGAGFGFTGIAMGVSAVLSVLVFKHKLDKFCECD
jgi:hypothetical protein